ncbi:MAG: hypothetical protein GY927_18605 [bacterium]|nr:hypothetical protein [bacterium]
MEIVFFTIIAVVLYVAAGWILDRIEIYLGKRLEQRSVVYFVILLVLAVSVFAAIERLAPALKG